MQSIQIARAFLLGAASFGCLVSQTQAGPQQAIGLEPMLCQPGQEAEVFFNGFTNGLQQNQITLEFDSSVPGWVQDYILDYWADLEGSLNTVIGPPSGTFTVTVIYDPNPAVGGSYSFGTNRLRFSTLPVGYNERFFNGTFAHEMAHAYTDAALEQGFSSWAAEGVAVAATAILEKVMAPQWNLDVSDRGLEYLSAMYDNVSQSGADSLGGSATLIGNVAPVRSYMAAGGVFWFLTVSQDSSFAGLWSQYTYLSRFLAEIYANGDGLTTAEVLDAVEATAPDPLDKLAPRAWVQAQPVTVRTVPAGTYIYMSLSSPFRNTGQTPTLEYQVFNRSASGTVTRLYGLPVEIRAYDLAGNLACSLQHVAINSGFGAGFQVVTLCQNLYTIPGAYSIEVDASAYGGGSKTIAAMSVAQDASGYAASSGSGVAFFDPSTQRVKAKPFSLSFAVLGGAWSGAYLVDPLNQAQLPSILRLSLLAITPGGNSVFDRTMPLPFRRVVRLDLATP